MESFRRFVCLTLFFACGGADNRCSCGDRSPRPWGTNGLYMTQFLFHARSPQTLESRCDVGGIGWRRSKRRMVHRNSSRPVNFLLDLMHLPSTAQRIKWIRL
jgi:hypothetical protein